MSSLSVAQKRLIEIVKSHPGAATGGDILDADHRSISGTADWMWHTTQGVHQTAASLVRRGHLIKGRRGGAIAYTVAGRREITTRPAAPAGELPTFSKLMGRVFS